MVCFWIDVVIECMRIESCAPVCRKADDSCLVVAVEGVWLAVIVVEFHNCEGDALDGNDAL